MKRVKIKDITRNLSNLPGWRTHRKIVVFESDDWGSIRMPSVASFNTLEKAGLNLTGQDALRYNLNDSLASTADLENLFEILYGTKDCHDNPAVFTPITIVANPDFQKIKESEFNEYYYEPFTETLKRYPGCEESFSAWKEGIRNKVFVPQMHGREHLNVTAWMKSLRNNDQQTLLAFHEGMWGFVPDQELLKGVDFQAAYLLSDPLELEFHKKVIQEGLDLFEKLFGYRAVYFVPPNGPFNNKLNRTLADHGIKFRSAAKIQQETIGHGKFKKSFHWLGQKEQNGITYISRNCFFEPSQPGKDWVNSCLSDIEIAFRWHKPALVSTHRVNYIGSLYESNRDKGLKELKSLLQSILQKWPEVEFMTTEQLGNLITEK